jgi:hypothetical protein
MEAVEQITLAAGKWFFLRISHQGSVDKPAPKTEAAKQDEAEKAAVGFVISRCNPPLLFQMANAVLDTRSSRVGRLVNRILHCPVSLRRDLGPGTAVL